MSQYVMLADPKSAVRYWPKMSQYVTSVIIQTENKPVVKRPSHDKFLLANMSLLTPKSWPTLAFTRQTHVKSQHTPTRNMASVVQWHTRRVAASGLLLFYVFRRRNNKKRWRNRKAWVKPYIARNPSLGVFNTLVQELRAEDKAAFKLECRANQVMSGRILDWLKFSNTCMFIVHTSNASWRTRKKVGENRDKFYLSPTVGQHAVVSFTHANVSCPINNYSMTARWI